MMITLPLLAALIFGGVSDAPMSDWTHEFKPAGEFPKSVGQPLSADRLAELKRGTAPLPYGDLTTGLRTPDGTLWLGTTKGLLRLEPGADRYLLFHSRRWLPDDRIDELALAGNGAIWARTPGGMVRLWQRQTTLDQKMTAIHTALRAHHIRLGMVGAIQTKTPGTTKDGYAQPSNDNDGLWTSLYVAAEAFRYGSTGEVEARKNAWQSLSAMLFLEQVTGIPGFVARSVVPASDDPRRYGGQWHRSANGRWWWKGDTSSDEVDGHYFAHAIYYDLAATDEQKEKIRGLITRMTDHILDHGGFYVGPSGKPTTWGVWAPEKLNHDLKWIGERGLNSLEWLSHLKVAEHITGLERYTEAIKELNDRYAYDINTVRQKFIWPANLVNHSDDELAFVAYYPLLWYERDARQRKIYLLSIERSWRIERPEHSPLFNFIYAAARQANRWKEPSQRPSEAFVDPKVYDRDLCIAWFREVPTDMYRWSITNHDRHDLGPLSRNRSGQVCSRFVLPIGERPLNKWNGDPYQLDGGGDGRERDDGTFVLLPYWMGRYHRLLE